MVLYLLFFFFPIVIQERAKERRLKEDMDSVLREKEQQLLEMQKQHQQVSDTFDLYLGLLLTNHHLANGRD